MVLLRTVSFVFLIAVLSLSGCAIFRANDLPEIGTLPGPAGSAPKPTVGYVFNAVSDMSGTRVSNENVRAIQEGEFVEVLRESGYFASLEKGKNAGKDIQISIDLVNSGDSSALVAAVITGLSLYTIPSWATDTFEATCKVTTADGKSREYKFTDSAKLVQWLPMLFVFPFKNFGEVTDLRKNIYKNLIVKMQADGILPKPGKPAKTSRTMFLLESPTA